MFRFSHQQKYSNEKRGKLVASEKNLITLGSQRHALKLSKKTVGNLSVAHWTYPVAHQLIYSQFGAPIHNYPF